MKLAPRPGAAALDVARRTAGITVNFVAESQTVTEGSAPTWDNVNLVARKLAALIKMSSAVDQDSIIDLGTFVIDELAFALAKREDELAFNGTGISTDGGTRGITQLLIDGNHGAGRVAAASGHDLFTEIDAPDLASLIGALPAYALPRAKFFISTCGYGQTFARLAATSGGLVATIVDGRLQANYLGFPVVLTQVMPTSGTQVNKIMVLFGDLSQCVTLGDRRTIGLRMSEERYFDQDMLGLLGTERISIVAHDLGDASIAGPIVGLMGN